MLGFTAFQKVMWNITSYCISEGHMECKVLVTVKRNIPHDLL
jgi:hypothetical protein